MKRGAELYKGKAKTVYATEDARYLLMHYRDDVSAFDGVKLAKLMFWKPDEKDKPEQYRIKVAEVAPNSVVSVQDTTGAPEKSTNGDKILALLREQLK
jgi:uncharacterized lipoprotein